MPYGSIDSQDGPGPRRPQRNNINCRWHGCPLCDWGAAWQQYKKTHGESSWEWSHIQLWQMLTKGRLCYVLWISMTRMVLDQTCQSRSYTSNVCTYMPALTRRVQWDGNIPEQFHPRAIWSWGTPAGNDIEGCTVQLDAFTRETVQHNQASNIFHCNT